MSGLEKHICRYIYNLKKDEGYDSDDAEHALLCKVKEIVHRTKTKKSQHNKSANCEKCYAWINQGSDRILYKISSIQDMGFRNVGITKELLCDRCCDEV